MRCDRSRRPSTYADDLLPLTDAVELLGFASVTDADLLLIDTGRRWYEADILNSKLVFAGAARSRAPLVRAIARALRATGTGPSTSASSSTLLGRGLSEDEARSPPDTAIDWGRSGELRLSAPEEGADDDGWAADL